MLHHGQAEDGERGRHQREGEDVPDVGFVSPVVVDALGHPVEDRDDEDGREGAEQQGQVDQEVGVARVLAVAGHVTRHQVVHYEVEGGNLKTFGHKALKERQPRQIRQ